MVYFPFLNWDDFEFIRDNPVLHSTTFLNITRIFTPGGIPGEKLYIPLTYVSYFLENIVFGLTSSIVHLDNLILHLANTLLVLLFFSSIGSRRPATLSATFFALHPLNVEAVVWAMGRKDLLSTFWGLIAILSYCQMTAYGRKRWYGVSIISFILSLLAKPTLLILPGLLFIIDKYFDVQITRRQWYLKIPYLVLSIAAFAMSLIMPNEQPGGIPSLAFRLIHLPGIMTSWALKILLILPPNPFYCWPTSYAWKMIAISCSMVILTSMLIIYLGFTKKFRGLIFGLQFFIISALPALSLVITPREFMTADRYGYFPLIGIFYGISTIFAEISNRSRGLFRGLVSCCLAAAIIMTYFQIDVWKESVLLWEKAKENCPDNVLIYNNLGMAYVDSGQPAKAISVFQNGLNISPDYIPIMNNLGRLYFDQNDLNAAKKILESAVSKAPNSALAHKNLGDVYSQLGHMAQAITCFNKCIIMKPDNLPAYVSLGNCLLKNNQLDEAKAIYKSGLEHDSKNPYIHLSLGIIYEKQGHHRKAVEAYKQAILYSPDLIDAHYNLANIYSSQKKIHLAEKEYLLALNNDPHHLEALINLGNLYFGVGRMDYAKGYYQKAIRLEKNNNPIPHYNLGLIYVYKKQFKKAAGSFNNSLNIAPDFGPAHYEISKIYYISKDILRAKEHLKRATLLGIPVDKKFAEKLNNPK